MYIVNYYKVFAAVLIFVIDRNKYYRQLFLSLLFWMLWQICAFIYFGRSNKKREYKNKKFGFGGQKKRGKQNTSDSARDMSDFNPRVNQKRPGQKVKKVDKLTIQVISTVYQHRTNAFTIIFFTDSLYIDDFFLLFGSK